MASADIEEVPLSPEEIMSSFVSLAAEGDIHAQRGYFTESINSYTKALTFRPSDKNVLVSRSRCHLKVGDADLSLMDAEESLKGDPNYFKGLFQKAEALYAMGDFEMALMFYHRGNKLRPELEEFRIGIQKSREAIENSIGDPKECKIVISPELKKLVLKIFSTTVNNSKKESSRKAADLLKNNNNGNSMSRRRAASPGSVPQTPVITTVNPNNPASVSAFLVHRGITPPPCSTLTSTMECKLLGDLYEDKAYLSKLLSDKDLIEHPNDQVLRLVSDGLRYFHTRIDFWRQQNPLYARHSHHLKAIKFTKKKPVAVEGSHKSSTKRSMLPPIHEPKKVLV